VTAPSNQVPLLRVESVSRHFSLQSGLLGRSTGVVRAVEEVSFTLAKGEVLGLVGESGCGKSTLARTILRLDPATSGRVWWKGEDLFAASRSRLRALRRELQVVFQDPTSALDPRWTAWELAGEAFVIQGGLRASERRARVRDLFERVGLRDDLMDRWPHELSGGQKQRLGIARALAAGPELLVLDEPLSALDVSTQALVMNVLLELGASLGLSYLVVSDVVRAVRHLADRVAVMYLGRIVELAPAAAFFASPAHPYAQVLLASVPGLEPSKRVVPVGEPPDPAAPPPGCAFHPRCPLAVDRCRSERPVLVEQDGRSVACHRAGEPIPLGIPLVSA